MATSPEPNRPPGIRDRFSDLYKDLRPVAKRLLDTCAAQSLSATDLTHEVYIKLNAEEIRRQAGNRLALADETDAVFKACFGAACRDILFDRRRRKRAAKRGGGVRHQELDPSIAFEDGQAYGAVELEETLRVLAEKDQNAARIAEMRVYSDLTIPECAELLGISPRTADRRWAFARAWIRRELR